MTVHRWRRSISTSVLHLFTITCPNVTSPEVTTCTHESNPCSKTPTFWEVHSDSDSDPEADCQSTLCLCTTISALNPLRMVYMCITHVAARKLHPCPSNTRRRFHRFLVIYRCLDKGGGGGYLETSPHLFHKTKKVPQWRIIFSSK